MEMRTNALASPQEPSPLLTIAIPTWNRASYLKLNLEQLQRELATVPPRLVEVLVSDNSSTDSTPQVVEQAQAGGLPVRSIRNTENIGWARNFLQCFDLASGTYVLLLGDDDLFVDGGLAALLQHLRTDNYGVVCVQPYGYDVDFRAEFPGASGRDRVFTDSNHFLLSTSRCFTALSACVINKSLIPSVDTREFIHSDLAAFPLVLRAALAAEKNLFIERYLVACKRQNSFSYDYFDVFVDQFWTIIDSHVKFGLRPETVRKLERRRLISYYPFYLLDFRLARRGDPAAALERLNGRFNGRALLRIWLAPIALWPRPLAVAWGTMATFIGRTLDGQLKRMVTFGWHRIRRAVLGRRTGGRRPPHPPKAAESGTTDSGG